MAGSVLVTGGAGYIGSVVVAQLLGRGYEVVVLDDLSRGHRQAVAPEATFVRGGIGDRGVLDELLRRHPCEALVHLAAYALVGESVAQPEMYRANNVTAGRVLLEGVGAAGVRRVVFSSSCAVYGHPPATPISEQAPLMPVNPYGETKREFERLLTAFAAGGGATGFRLRYFKAPRGRRGASRAVRFRRWHDRGARVIRRSSSRRRVGPRRSSAGGRNTPVSTRSSPARGPGTWHTRMGTRTREG